MKPATATSAPSAMAQHAAAYKEAYGKSMPGKDLEDRGHIFKKLVEAQALERKHRPVAPHQCHRDRREVWSSRLNETMIFEWRH